MRALAILGAAAALAASGCVPPPPEPPEADPRIAVYNRACELALEGKVEPAFAALEEAVGEGFGRIGFDHLAADPDLEPLHGDPRWGRLVERLSWVREDSLAFTASRAGDRAGPLVVFLLPDGMAFAEAKGRLKEPWDVWVAVPAPPYQEAPGVLRWTTRLDPGNRAAEKVERVVMEADNHEPVDTGRCVLVASGEGTIRLAWEILLRRPTLFRSAVLDGPQPPAWALLDRGKEKARILEPKPTLEAALVEALR